MNKEEVITLTYKLGLTALGVGSLILGRRYYESYKSHKIANECVESLKNAYDNCFLIGRTIDPDCDGKELVIGVGGKNNPNNIISNQGIKLGEFSKIKRLNSFYKVDNGLVYNFEENTSLILTKKPETNKVMFAFQTPEKTIVKEMNENILKNFKTIGMSSSELDKIAELK